MRLKFDPARWRPRRAPAAFRASPGRSCSGSGPWAAGVGEPVEHRLGVALDAALGIDQHQDESASLAPPQAVVTIAVSSRRFGLKMPGVSTNTICASSCVAMPRTMARVVCTLCVTIETFAPTSRLTSVDLPAFGAPISATKPEWVRGRAVRTPSAAGCFGAPSYSTPYPFTDHEFRCRGHCCGGAASSGRFLWRARCPGSSTGSP